MPVNNISINTEGKLIYPIKDVYDNNIDNLVITKMLTSLRIKKKTQWTNFMLF